VVGDGQSVSDDRLVVVEEAENEEPKPALRAAKVNPAPAKMGNGEQQNSSAHMWNRLRLAFLRMRRRSSWSGPALLLLLALGLWRLMQRRRNDHHED